MKITKYHQPGTISTLFDQALDHYFDGTLYFVYPTLPPQTKSNFAASKRLTKTLATLLLIVSLFGFGSLILPVVIAETITHFGPIHASQDTNNALPLNNLPDLKNYKSAAELIQQQQVKDQFKIAIPKINVESQIIPEVNINSEPEYLEALKHGVAHARGSYLPGGNGPVILFAHSTDTISDILQYNAKFYAVKDLHPEDDIYITYEGKQYHYQIHQQQVIDPKDLDIIRNSTDNLILVTCYPPGTDWQRLITFARLIPS